MSYNMCYLVTNRTGIHIIDPGWDLPQNTDRLLAVIESAIASVGPHRVPVVSVIATHSHRDHAGLLGTIRERIGTCVLSIGDGTASACHRRRTASRS
jgi:glyoxylase-like metal-dependent hydrolase (beta-lactamase superfamily II)